MRLWQLSISRQALYVLFSRENHFSSCQGENENKWGRRRKTNPSHLVSTQPRPLRVSIFWGFFVPTLTCMGETQDGPEGLTMPLQSRQGHTRGHVGGEAYDHFSSPTTRPHNWYISLSPWEVAEKPTVGETSLFACANVSRLCSLTTPDQYSITEGDFFSCFSPLLFLGAERPARTWVDAGLANTTLSWDEQ